jgi:hypothetical protein
MYCDSSINRTTAVPAPFAAAPTCSNRDLRSPSKSPVVSETRFRLEIQTYFNILILDLEGFGEPCECSQSFCGEAFGSLHVTQPEQRKSKLPG